MERTFHMLLYRAFHAQRHYLRPCLCEIGLEVGQPKLLGYLAGHGPCRQRELADYFEIDSAAVSRMLDSLEKGGFVTRRMDEESRRSNLIALTDKGRQAQQRWQEHCREMEDIMLQGFSDEEKARFADYLSRAWQNFRDRRGDGACGT